MPIVVNRNVKHQLIQRSKTNKITENYLSLKKILLCKCQPLNGHENCLLLLLFQDDFVHGKRNMS